ncbi:SCP-like extracellular protein [Alkaliphilus pronyensis]|uniref:SCP-like extracellular protein n=1 Tax=Alkaliphilus pronyensis TaxID=1482732 RepID=A0A6I0EYD4_9FIRM|nr:CAP domain-containing protein [Alkaliphilus pronyensis]KAB3529974.1 SCP-like extracellular protein [Alkaliphilus pronyensis]
MRVKLFIVFIALLVITACSPPQERPPAEDEFDYMESSIFHTAPVRHCRITQDTVDVKSGTGRDFETVGTLKENDVVRVLQQANDWYIIQLDNNQIGSIEVDSAVPVVVERTGDDNLEETPNQNNEIFEEGNDVQLDNEDDNITPNNPTPGRQPQANNPQESNVRSLTDEEQQLIDLVNNERQNNDLPALKVDYEVTRVARIKSQDMVDNNYFSHYSPVHGSPFEMLDNYGIDYHHAGENIAANNSIENAHTSLMNSSGHRKNILNVNFTHIGIGIRPSDKYGYMITQMFISKPK